MDDCKDYCVILYCNFLRGEAGDVFGLLFT